MNLRVESAQSEISDLEIEIRQKNALLVSEGLKGSTMESRLRQVESENRDRMEKLESQVGELEHELSFLTANLAETQDLVQNLYVDAENKKKLLDSAEGLNKTQAGEIEGLKLQVGQGQKSIELEKKLVEGGRRTLESAGKANELNLGEIVKLNDKICTLNGSVMEKNGELSKTKARMTQFEDESATNLTHNKTLMKRLAKLENVERKLLENTKNLTTADKNFTDLSQKFSELEGQEKKTTTEID
jgi:chromosome segregation ATPase